MEIKKTNIIFKNETTTVYADAKNISIEHSTKDNKISIIKCSIHELIEKLIKNILKDE